MNGNAPKGGLPIAAIIIGILVVIGVIIGIVFATMPAPSAPQTPDVTSTPTDDVMPSSPASVPQPSPSTVTSSPTTAPVAYTPTAMAPVVATPPPPPTAVATPPTVVYTPAVIAPIQSGGLAPQESVRWHFASPGKILFGNDPTAVATMAKIKQAGRFTLSNVTGPTRIPIATPAGTFTYAGTERFDDNMTWVLYTPATKFAEHSFATFSF